MSDKTKEIGISDVIDYLCDGNTKEDLAKMYLSQLPQSEYDKIKAEVQEELAKMEQWLAEQIDR